MALQGRAKLLPGVALGLALTAAFAWRFDFLVDDAFISFRYARHLAEGHGLVWNIGEDPPVEGFSNFLWVALCAGFEALGLSPLIGSRVASTLAALWLTWNVARAVAARAPAGSGLSTWSAVFLATLPPIGVWATSGLETMAVAATVFACFEALARPNDAANPGAARRTWLAAFWAACVVLLRADGFVWISAALAAAACVRWLDARGDGRAAPGTFALRPLAPVALAALATTLAYVLWRHSYFGEWGPNTARVKVHVDAQALERGLKYIASLGLAVLSLPLALAGAVFVARRDRTHLAAPALVFVGLASSYVALVGGDWMMMHRMLVPALPFAALAFTALLAAISSKALRAALGAGALALSVLPSFDVHLAPRALRELTHFRWGQEYRTEYDVWRKGVVDIENWILVGRALALHTRPGESIVLGNIGAFGYFAENLVVYDTHGLTNKAPLTPANPAARGMPGHDFKVDIGVFDAALPTYKGASLVPADVDPLDLVPASWRELDENGRKRLNAFASERFEVALIPLREDQGFPPGKALLLVKNRR
jgi:arabinofuranosyltransferase